MINPSYRKFIFLIVVVIFISTLVDYQRVYCDDGQDAESEQVYFGAINKNLIIKMFLNRQGEKLSGYYYCLKHNKPIKLEGKVTADEKFTITEYLNDNSANGVFSGSFTDDHAVLSGSWSDAINHKSLPFIAGKEVVIDNIELLGRRYKVIQRADIKSAERISEDVFLSDGNEERGIFIGPRFVSSNSPSVDYKSIKLSVLNNEQKLILLEWSEGPDGLGNHYGLKYIIFKERNFENMPIRLVQV